MIADNWKPNEQYDPYAYVKYFVRLQDMIEHDTIFQKVLEKVKTYMHSCLPFQKALGLSFDMFSKSCSKSRFKFLVSMRSMYLH